MEPKTVNPALPEMNIARKSKRRTILYLLRKDWQLYSLLILPILYLLIFKYGPMIGNVIAFRRFVPGGSIFGEQWVGLHYFRMFTEDPTFWRVFSNTLILGGLTMLLTFPMPIVFALLLNEVKNKKFKKFVQTASYLPHFLSIVIVAGMILQLTALNGSINSLIQFFGGDPINFMQQADWFRTIYVTSEIWQGMGWGAILYLAALTTIDDSLYEAARIDGANRWKQTLHVTIPGILPTIVTVLILNMGSFLAVGFEKILLLYNPLIYETSDVISTYLYRVGLGSSNFSYATAIGLFESVIGLVLVLSVNAISRKVTERSLW
ncbi:ABC transporter permease subunit [Paenibacillus sp. 453mf]|uniref:ABC transporter permease n=1 Tax=Paenibacillus sp. 453mf TaxID=1761874 RepID=UPI0008E2418B|nr:ABC transporter permease subunit [Paenibacillus sp. 453mf]SFS36580.1 carbohydrate ABC transporter membrane protein 1, CUT1 family [Paenibacillus sp. 453mf]